MRKTRIYTPQTLCEYADFELEPESSRHLARALRMAEGAEFLLFDGRGGEYPACITALDKQVVCARTGAREAGIPASPLRVHLGIAVSRGERMDWVVQKATELGVAQITPLLTERCEVRLPAERTGKKLRHWRQVMLSACEQSGRCDLAVIHPVRELGEWLEDSPGERRYILDPQAGPATLETTAPAEVAVLSGPEGGFTDAEVTRAAGAGFAPLRLGPRVMRTETAPLAAIAVLQSRWGDLRQGEPPAGSRR